MKAIDFFKKFGIEKAKYFCSFMDDSCDLHDFKISDLKQIVEAFELVESKGGLSMARYIYDYSHNNPLAHHLRETHFIVWLASANREGYVLVKKSFISDIHDMALDGKYLRETDQSQEKFLEIQEYCKEAMIEESQK